jgi:hypothetical protein
MKIIFFLNTIISICIFLVTVKGFLKHYKNERNNKIINHLAILGLFYLFFSILSFLWFFNFLTYSQQDFVLLYFVLIMIQTFLILLIARLLAHGKMINSLLFIYLIMIVLLVVISHNSFQIALLFSFLFLLLFFLRLSFNKGKYLKISYFGIFYSLISLIFHLSLIFGYGNAYAFNLFSNLIFLALIVVFLKNLPNLPLRRKISKNTHYIISFFRYFTFIIVLTNLVFIGTVGMHEAGHFFIAKSYSCNYERIVYEGLLPHTEVLCSGDASRIAALVGGIGLPLVIALAIYLIGGKFLKDLAMLILGFNLIISARDLSDLGLSQNIIISVAFFGLISIIIGVVMLAKSRIEEHPNLLFN